MRALPCSTESTIKNACHDSWSQRLSESMFEIQYIRFTIARGFQTVEASINKSTVQNHQDQSDPCNDLEISRACKRKRVTDLQALALLSTTGRLQKCCRL